MELKFVPITKENIILATDIEMTIFPNFCGFNSYLRAYNKGRPYWLVFDEGDNIIGISGIYEYPELGESQTAWLGWFGVLKKYRGYGYGRQILIETINRAKALGYNTLRLYSSKRQDLCPNAVEFYSKISSEYNGFIEDYGLEQKDIQRIVVSFSLDGHKINKWDNKPLFLEEDEKDEKDGYLKYLSYKNKKD